MTVRFWPDIDKFHMYFIKDIHLLYCYIEDRAMNSHQITQGVFLILCLGAGSGPMAWAASGHAVIAHVDPGDLGAAAKMTKTIPKPVERILRKQKDLAQCFNGFGGPSFEC